MKIFQQTGLILTICVLLTSCQKFVDIKKTSTESTIETANDCQLIMDNYELFNSDYPFDGEGSADDYYINDLTYSDTYTSIEDQSVYTWDMQAIRLNSFQWVRPYNKIYHTNLVLETLAKLQGRETQAALNNLRGSALFLRAYALFQVAQLYAKPYGPTASQDMGVPIHLVSDINDTPGRGTVQETYDRIAADLIEAAAMLNETSSMATRPNKAAAFAMLARVYLSMEDYTNAMSAANSALQLRAALLDYNSPAVNKDPSSNTPFARYNPEVIFHSILASSTFLSPGNPFSNAAKIDLDLVNSYADNDLRKTVFFKPNLDVNEGTWRFTGNYEPTTSSTLFNGLSVDELYLVRAECYARSNRADLAMADLNMLLRNRWVTGSYTNMTAISADDALAKVLTERRKELVMRGQRWTDLRRLNKDERFRKNLSRTVTAGGASTTFTLPANDIRYTLLIPQEVITNSRLSQNPR
ncbi:hypothetical protein PBAL39_10281 [Pedobacter sp. BAL39]|uniref:RagB/SusD family nutrient uptake outer membrane protein n=1 Tax=Pedobacter sp. BAL39 TaxID=391596 RepID=UPI00015594E7|nr:RagB/SusD family nutrient uptake outer membrane protein [Pedobacter sp. BAL39]EDM37524.1 hypothetical protein PBAL39_10281 [Pedobacter sp. BAL39]